MHKYNTLTVSCGIHSVSRMTGRARCVVSIASVTVVGTSSTFFLKETKTTNITTGVKKDRVVIISHTTC